VNFDSEAEGCGTRPGGHSVHSPAIQCIHAAGALDTPMRGKFAIFDRNRRLSWKRCEIDPWLLRITNRKL